MKERLKYYLQLLKNKDIKKILERYNGYDLKDVDENNIVLTKETKFKYEIVKIENDSFIKHVVCEKRPAGIIITVLEQAFDTTAYSRGKKVLVNLSEKRYVITNAKLIKLFIDVNVLNLEQLYQKIRSVSIDVDAEMKTSFSTSMRYMIKNENGDWIKSGIVPTRTYLNGSDISLIYDDVNGNDKLYRIYDLYNGIINKRNEKDIESINLGVLGTEAFGLKTLRGITAKEDSLVGSPLEPTNQEYADYIKSYFFKTFGYDGEVKYDRDSLLKCITHGLPAEESAKIKVIAGVLTKN